MKKTFCHTPELDAAARLAIRSKLASNGCVEWLGCKRNGYGIIIYRGKKWSTHRLSYETHLGPVGKMKVLHRCDNPSCINPFHLELGTQADNMADCARKGRTAKQRGTLNPFAKLTDEQVSAIRADARKQWDIAHAYGIGQSHVSRIKRGESRA